MKTNYEKYCEGASKMGIVNGCFRPKAAVHGYSRITTGSTPFDGRMTSAGIVDLDPRRFGHFAAAEFPKRRLLGIIDQFFQPHQNSCRANPKIHLPDYSSAHNG